MFDDNDSRFAKSLAAAFDMDEAALVERAASLADRLVRHECRLHGVKTEAAIPLAARKHHVEEKVFKALRYVSRWPKEIGAGAYHKLESAVARLGPIEKRLKRELELADAAGLNDSNSKVYRVAGMVVAALDKTSRGAAR